MHVLGSAQSLEEERPQLVIREPGYRGIYTLERYIHFREVYPAESLLNIDQKINILH